MLLEYSTSNIILRIEMLTMKTFVIFCILAWFPFLQGLLIRSSRRFVFDTLFSFYYHDRVFTPLKNRLYKLTWTKKEQAYNWDSNISVTLTFSSVGSQAEKYAALKIFATVFSFSKNDMNSLFKIETKG